MTMSVETHIMGPIGWLCICS